MNNGVIVCKEMVRKLEMFSSIKFDFIGNNLSSINNFEQTCHPISTAPVDEHKIKELEGKIETLEDKQCCHICMDQLNNVAFDCGHLACSQCAQLLNKCHMCRKDIHQKIPLFWS